MDLLMDNNFDLNIVDGDFVIANDTQTDIQQSYFLLNSTYNYFKRFPFYALNFQRYQNGSFNKLVAKKEIRKILEQDGFNRIEINLNNLEDVNVIAERI